MDVTIKEIDRENVEMTVVIPASKVEDRIQRKLRELAKSARMNGFRRGKVPLSYMQARFGEQARREVLNDLIDETYPEAIQEQQLRPIEQGSIEQVDYEPGRDFSYRAVIQTEPLVELGRYTGLEVKRTRRTLRDEDLDEALESLRKQYANWVPVEDGAREGDQLVCDIQENDEAGSALEEGRYPNMEVELGEGKFGPIFDRKMLGVTPGESRNLKIINPDDDPDPDTAGKIEYYTVQVHEVKRPELAELDDEFAKEVPPGFDSLKELRAGLVSDLERRLDKLRGQEVDNNLMAQLVEAHDFDLPKKMVEFQLDALVERARENSGGPVDEKAIRSAYREEVVRNLCWSLIARSIIKAEDLGVDQADIDAEIERIAGLTGQDPAMARLQMKRSGDLEELETQLLDRKLMAFLRDSAVIVDVEPETADKDQ